MGGNHGPGGWAEIESKASASIDVAVVKSTGTVLYSRFPKKLRWVLNNDG
jgi:hypothetical protein